MITVAVLKINEPLVFTEIKGDLASMQKIVGGMIEMVALNQGLDLVCNEEGLLLNLPINFRYGTQPIVGDVFFTRHNEEGEPVSLTSGDKRYLSELAAQIRSSSQRTP